MNTRKVTVIGAGFAGLASANLLAKEGFDVTVVDMHDRPGGVARTFEQDGYVFDMGPSWYLMTDVFEKYFSYFGKTTADYFRTVRTDPSYRVWFADQTADIPPSRKGACDLFETFEKGGAEKLDRYLRRASYKYRTALDEFLYREYRSVFDFFRPKMIINAPFMHLLETLDRYVSRFFKDKRAKKILEYNVVFLGCSPRRCPALYSLMAHVDLEQGVFYPEGGIGSLIQALYSIGKELGVHYQFNTEVKRIITEKKRAVRMETNKGSIPADIILSTIDYHHLDTDLLAEQSRSYSLRYWRSRVMAPSAVLIYLGLTKKIPALAHHTLYLSPGWDEHFEALFDRPSWPEDPSYYIGCPSRTDTTVAPQEGETVFILVPVAPGLDDTEEMREKYFNKVLTHIEMKTGTSIRESIAVKKIFTHRDFSREYNAFKGTALGLAHTLFQTAIFRPAHRSKKVSNLFCAGHYTHPGIGMPMALIGAEIVAGLIGKEKHEQQ